MPIQVNELGLSRTIEAQIINNTSTIVKFDVNDNSLDNAIVHGIALMFYPVTKSPTNRINYLIGGLQAAYITLVNDKNFIFNKSLPLEFLLNNDDNIVQFHPKKISIRNSYIELPNIGTYAPNIVNTESIIFTFFYKIFDPSIHRLNDIGELIF